MATSPMAETTGVAVRCPHGKRAARGHAQVGRGLRIGICLLELHLLPLARAFGPGLLREWQVHARDLLIVTKVGHGFDGFQHETLQQERFQSVGTVNYPDERVPYTRITEYKHLTGQVHSATTAAGTGRAFRR